MNIRSLCIYIMEKYLMMICVIYFLFNIIKKLRPVTFDWIDDTRNNNVSGFIAQEVKEVLPNLIDGTEYDSTLNDPEKGTKGGIKSQGYSINSVGVTAHLTKALQEEIAKIETLEAKVSALEGS